MSNEFSMEEIIKALQEAWETVPMKRNMQLWTGKGGAIKFQEDISGRELTQEEKENYKDGIYEISNTTGIKYLGKYE